MTDPKPAPDNGVPPPLAAPPPYGYPQYSYPQYAYPQYSAPLPTPKRPPLTKREKRGTFWAGAVGFNVLTFGFTLVIVPIIVGLLGAFVTSLIGFIARTSDDLDADFFRMQEVLESLDYGLLIAIGIGVAVVGLAIMAGALFLSKGILRAHGIDRAWPVTWSGAGTAVFAFWMLEWIPGLAAQVALLPLAANGVNGVEWWAVYGVVAIVLSLATNAVIGWLAWWWMTFAFRPATRVDTPTAETF